jgi:tyramine---L-glutamate ligase
MKILIFEYITGGGFNKQQLPDTLRREGRLMLQALLDNFLTLTDLDLVVMLDQRLLGTVDVGPHRIVVIDETHDSHQEFIRLAQECDAVWPIAPEFDDILQTLCELIETTDKPLLTSPSSAVKLTGNKFHTYQQLQKHAIATVPTCLLTTVSPTHKPPFVTTPYSLADVNEWIIKPINGVGCFDSWLISDLQNIQSVEHKERYIIQPHLHGQKTSLSCLFKNGLAWIVCINLQHFTLVDQHYQLSALVVNHDPDIGRYQDMVDDLAYAFPDLWGYVGIDLIETPTQTWVLEINPRLTTAFVGIEVALGINIADTVLQLLNGPPILKPQHNKSVTVTVNQDGYAD